MGSICSKISRLRAKFDPIYCKDARLQFNCRRVLSKNRRVRNMLLVVNYLCQTIRKPRASLVLLGLIRPRTVQVHFSGLSLYDPPR